MSAHTVLAFRILYVLSVLALIRALQIVHRTLGNESPFHKTVGDKFSAVVMVILPGANTIYAVILWSIIYRAHKLKKRR